MTALISLRFITMIPTVKLQIFPYTCYYYNGKPQMIEYNTIICCGLQVPHANKDEW